MELTAEFQIEGTVLRKYTGPGGDVVIPPGVTQIGLRAFFERDDLTSVVIPDGVTYIAHSAFFRCENLTQVSLPESVTYIGISAFQDCKRLRRINIPNSIKLVDQLAFSGCREFADPDGFVIVRDSCHHTLYQYYGTAANAVIPAGITRIGNAAFRGCNALTEIVIPDSVTFIGCSVFADCENLTTVTIPAGVSNIGDWAFCRCRRLRSVTLPQSLKEIPEKAFSGCESLAEITIPDSVTGIRYRAFYGCKSLSAVRIPDRVEFLDEEAFCKCENLTSVMLPGRSCDLYEGALDCGAPLSVTLPKSAPMPHQLEACFRSTEPSVLRFPEKSLMDLDPYFEPAVIGYTEMLQEGQTFSPELEEEYRSFIDVNHWDLRFDAIAHPVLLRYMMDNTLIPCEDIDALLALADQENRPDLKAELLQYAQAAFSGTGNPLHQFDL